MKDGDRATCLDAKNNVVVHACAGSGKTWLLVSRIVRILLDDPKASLPSILAITFTNDAAREIRERVGERLREMAGADDDRLARTLSEIGADDGPEAKKRARGLYQGYVMARPQLSVHTFHGWFGRLADFLPWEASLPLLGQVDENPEGLRGEAWRETLLSAGEGGRHAGALERLLGTHKPAEIKKVLDKMLDMRLDVFLHLGCTPDEEGMPERFMRAYDEGVTAPVLDGRLLALVSPGSRGPGAALSSGALAGSDAFWELVFSMCMVRSKNATQAKHLDSVLAAMKAMGSRPYLAYLILRGALFTKAGKRKKWIENFAGAHLARDVCSVMEAAEEVDRCKEARKYNELMATMGNEYARRHEQAKEARGTHEYSDLELVPMRHLLHVPEGGGEVRVREEAVSTLIERMDASYRHILVDEFQDTSPPQWLMLRAWLDASASGDNMPSVMIVGDPKQSIYSFRAGNPRLLATATRYLKERYRGKEIRVNTTRRCPATVTDAVNELFTGDPELFGMEGFERHDTLATEVDGCVRVHDLVEPAPRDKRRGEAMLMRNPLHERRRESATRDAVAMEGRTLARDLRRTLGRGEVGDWVNDVMVLVPARTGADSLIEGISSEGVPCAFPGGGNRLEALECRDMAAMLRSIYDPTYGLAVAHVLRSPVFDASEDDVWAVFEAGRKGRRGGGCDWLRGLREAEGSEELSRAQGLLGGWRESYARDKLPSHETLAKCYHEGDIVARYARSVPLEIRKRVVQNLEWVLNLPIEAEGGRLAQVSEFARWMGESEIKEPKPPEQPGVLKLTTVHGSKGLESPVVAIAGANFVTSNKAARLLAAWDLDERDDRPSHVSFVQSNKRATAEQREAIDDEARSEAREAKNMLYVAMTRAKHLLVVSATKKSRNYSKWHEAVSGALGAMGARRSGGALTLGAVDARSIAGDRKYPDVLANAQDPPEKAGKHGKRRTRLNAAARRGTLLHNLVALRVSGVDDADEQRRLLAVSKREFAGLAEVADRMTAPGTAFGDLLAGCESVEAELPVIDAKGKGGRIDCLVRSGGTTWIVDLKTGEKPSAERHREQLQRYADVVGSSLGGGEVKAAIVDANGSLEVLADLAGAGVKERAGG